MFASEFLLNIKINNESASLNYLIVGWLLGCYGVRIVIIDYPKDAWPIQLNSCLKHIYFPENFEFKLLVPSVVEINLRHNDE